MFKLLSAFFRLEQKGMIARLLSGAGLGLGTFALVATFSDYYLDKVTSSAGALGGVSGLLGLSGLSDALSMVIGAYAASAYISTFTAGLKIVKK